MCKCNEESAKTHIIIGLREQRFGKGRKQNKDTKKKEFDLNIFWTKLENYGSYRIQQKLEGKACFLIPVSYIACAWLKGNGSEIRARKKIRGEQPDSGHTFPCRDNKLDRYFGTDATGEKKMGLRYYIYPFWMTNGTTWPRSGPCRQKDKLAGIERGYDRHREHR